MTAFNTSQLDEEHQDSIEVPIRESVEAFVRESTYEFLPSSSWDSVSSERRQPHACRCCCNKESSGAAEAKDTIAICSRSSTVCGHHALNPEKLPVNFMSKQEVLCFLNHELEQERIAAESAANEAISMILRLQVEKAALQMEARHYQELLEARALYDEETISQLKEVISNQEADRITLEREIDECKQALQMFSEHLQGKDRQVCYPGGEDICNTFGITASAPSYSQKIQGGIATPQADKESCITVSIKEKIDRLTVHSTEGGQQIDSESKEEAKTKHVVSISNGKSREIALQAHAKVDYQLGRLQLEGNQVFSKENWFDIVVRESWSSILTQLSRLQKQIWIMGLSSLGAQHGLVKYQGCISNCREDLCADTCRSLLCVTCENDVCHDKDCNLSRDFLPQNVELEEKKLPVVCDSCPDISGLKKVIEGQSHDCIECFEFHHQGKAANAHADSWSEILAIINSCLLNLEERFATYQNTLQTLEVARKAMAEAAKTMSKNRGRSEKVLLKASNLLKEFLSFTGLGCDILNILHKLVSDLTKAADLAEASYVDTELGCQPEIDTCAMEQGNTFAVSEEVPEEDYLVARGGSSPNSSSALDKLALLWSSSFEWLSNEKCRAETAFSGWDHI